MTNSQKKTRQVIPGRFNTQGWLLTNTCKRICMAMCPTQREKENTKQIKFLSYWNTVPSKRWFLILIPLFFHLQLLSTHSSLKRSIYFFFILLIRAIIQYLSSYSWIILFSITTIYAFIMSQKTAAYSLKMSNNMLFYLIFWWETLR